MSSQTDRLNTALAGRYRIERHLGEGGMASVYLCEDLKHDRKVALKLLKPELAAVLGAERFVVEIKTTAAMQHPHILPLFDSGTADGFLFYVMPYIEGETLRDRLNKETQLGVDEAVRIAREVLDALQYAHEHGIVHRDVKPENILLHGGHAMVADFGIALAVSAAAGGRMTETGLSLGTPHYMSPEQATAEKEITARSDVYSLGSVLYEMLTGNPPFTGAVAQQIIMKIITEPAEPVTKYRKSVPLNVAAAVLKSLEKLPADRFENAKAFRDALGNALYTDLALTAGGRANSGAERGVSRRMLVTTIAVLAIVLAVTAGVAWRATRPLPALPASRFTIGLPDSVTIFAGGGTKLALSKDGSKLVFVGMKQDKRALYVRRIDDPVAQLVRGSEFGMGSNNVSPSFSPDGNWIVFEVDRIPHKIPTAGGTVQVLADSGYAFSWGERNVLVFGRNRELWAGTVDGRDARRLARPDSAHGVYGINWPEVLPGAEYALVALNRAPGGLQVIDSMRLGIASLQSGEVRDLGVYGTNPHYVSSGYIVFGRSGGLVFAAPFSLGSRKISGPATLILQDVWQGSGGATDVSVSENGVLAYHEGVAGNLADLVTVDRLGRARRIAGDQRDVTAPRVSSDGRRVAVNTRSPNATFGVSLVDVGTGQREILAPADSGRDAEWSRDGRILFKRTDHGDVWVLRAPDRSRADSVLTRVDGFGSGLIPGVPHGLAALFLGPAERRAPGLYVMPMDSTATLRPFAVGAVNIHSPAISADGRLVAWVSDETGPKQVYVQPLAGGPRVQVSIGFGSEPGWSHEGSTLFYLGPTKMMLAEIGESPLRVTRRDSLFSYPYLRVTRTGRNWDVFPGAKEFITVQSVSGARSSVLMLINWQQLLATAGAPAAAAR